jgi:hypothetical protein
MKVILTMRVAPEFRWRRRLKMRAEALVKNE